MRKVSVLEAFCYDNDMESTSPYTDLDKEVTGYMLNAALDSHSQEIIKHLQQMFNDEYGDLIYSLASNALHITLMDWVAPLVDYKTNKDALFNSLFPQYDSVLSEIIESVAQIPITFDTIGVSAGAIFLRGHDNGQFQAIRDGFTNRINLISGTKQPPSIIHTSIMRFNDEVDLKPIEVFASGLSIDFTQNINEFRLVNEKKIPMVEYNLVKLYYLGK